jgi:hypothetical protein
VGESLPRQVFFEDAVLFPQVVDYVKLTVPKGSMTTATAFAS